MYGLSFKLPFKSYKCIDGAVVMGLFSMFEITGSNPSPVPLFPFFLIVV